jgi:hypothetical protein
MNSLRTLKGCYVMKKQKQLKSDKEPLILKVQHVTDTRKLRMLILASLESQVAGELAGTELRARAEAAKAALATVRVEIAVAQQGAANIKPVDLT